MKKTKIQRIIHKIRTQYLNMNNAVIIIAFMIAAGWVWGSLTMMQRNYKLQRDLDEKSRQLVVSQLAFENAKLEQKYYKTTEYQELAARQRLGLALPGESVLILSEGVKNNSDTDTTIYTSTQSAKNTTNFMQWINFLLGGNRSSVSK